jgi:hypothetical protein
MLKNRRIFAVDERSSESWLGAGGFSFGLHCLLHLLRQRYIEELRKSSKKAIFFGIKI